jgi:hypothetical protein
MPSEKLQESGLTGLHIWLNYQVVQADMRD